MKNTIADPIIDASSADDIVVSSEDEMSYGSETSTIYTESSSRDENVEVQKIIRKETKDVLMWREIVTGMIIITAIIVTVTTYIFLQRGEAEDFQRGFKELALAILDSARYDMTTIFQSYKGLSDVETSFVKSDNSTWPFNQLPDFKVHGLHVRTITGTAAVWSAPIVTSKNRKDWEYYANDLTVLPIVETIFEIDDNGSVATVTGPGPYTPVWEMSPNPEPTIVPSPINFDMFSLQDPSYENLSKAANKLELSAVSEVASLGLFRDAFSSVVSQDEPLSLLVTPIFETFDGNNIVGFLNAIVPWMNFFTNVLTNPTDEVYCVLRNNANQTLSFLVQGGNVTYLGEGDFHPLFYDQYREFTSLSPYQGRTKEALDAGAILYTLEVYPSEALRANYHTSKPAIFTTFVGLIFFSMACTFFLYDRFVKRRNDKIINAAARSNAIVSSLFPSNIRDRLLAVEEEDDSKNQGGQWLAPKSGLKSFLQEGNSDDDLLYQTKPLADLFPETTVMFADMVGFTAWSSVREPSQVFTLLEVVYRAFDQIAKRRRVFKVETVGDCYVAVAGLPEPRRDHAIVMAKFATDCLHRVNQLTKKLEVTLGPDTGDLTVRIGLHSGPVTAGVLRGERSRFQLFGDTMNTTARMESTGIASKIQLSQETADLIVSAGKPHWIKPREEVIEAKGKGKMQTYWLETNNMRSPRKGSVVGSVVSSVHRGGSDDGGSRIEDDGFVIGNNNLAQRVLSEKTSRLIDWNVDVLLRLLKHIVARREATDLTEKETEAPKSIDATEGSTVLDEVAEIIALPEFDPRAAKKQRDPDSVEIPKKVIQQLHDLVTNIACLYHDNAFHNFEHASHVTMSVTKLLSRIVAPSELLDEFDKNADKKGKKRLASTLHDHTYGITSDPLTQFACVFSALVHDTDHQGVPNAQLIKEGFELCAMYKNKSIAEQNSVDLTWNMMMDDAYTDLRMTICANESEFKRFRQLVVNAVLATDIMDKDLKTLRNARWDKAFTDTPVDENVRDTVNRKATIVIEHLIQASDVAHTMQHWHIYRKWNERFFNECYKAYTEGRAEKDPSENWYNGEIGFFDFYIIPLAKKLKNCGVFGVSSDEYLQYALKNRQEWELRGQEVVAEMLQKVNRPVSD